MQVPLEDLLAEEFTERDYSEAILELRNLQRLGYPEATTWAFDRLTRRNCNPDVVLRIVKQWPTDRMVTPGYADSMYQRRCYRGARRFAEEFPVTNPFGELRVSHGGAQSWAAVEQPDPTEPVPSVAPEPAESTEEFNFHNWALLWINERAPEVQAKAEEYGSNSLMEMGRVFRRAQGHRAVSDTEALEVGAWLYAYGKIQRVADAMLRGELPQGDQWVDLTIYALMCLFVRAAGRWP